MVGGHETGNETYVLGLIEGFRALDGQLELHVYHSGSAVEPAGRDVRQARLLSGSPLTRLTFDLAVRGVRDRIDVLHTTYTAPLWSPCPVVLTVHDISFATHPEWFSGRDLQVLKTGVPWSMRRAARVITVSDLCRREIIEHYGLPEDKVVRIYNGPGPAAQSITDDAARAELRALGVEIHRAYVLAVGNVQPRKNLIRLIEAFEAVRSHLDCELVIVGPEHYRAELTKAAAAGLAGDVRFTGYVTDRQLAAFYACATAFAFPSLFEGFGLPAVEAMAHGIPVVCSNAGALPEVCGEAAVYFDPLDVGSIAEALDRVLSDQHLREQLSRLGLERQRSFSWSKAARETLDVYQLVRKGGDGRDYS